MQSVVADSARVERRRGSISLYAEGESLFEALVPRAAFVHRLVAAAGFVLFVALLARGRFYLPDNPVPITLQTFGILLMGGVLGWRWGLVSVVGYYLVGMAGAPVFQGGGNGWQYATGGATAGYLLGFIPAVAVVGYLSQRGWNRGRALWPMVLGSLVLYGPALVWVSVFDFGWPAEGELFSAAMYAFLPGDLVKLMGASLVVGAGWRYADSRRS